MKKETILKKAIEKDYKLFEMEGSKLALKDVMELAIILMVAFISFLVSVFL